MRTIKIGRNPDNDIVINDETTNVSGYHAILKVFEDGTFTICDKSTNGTFINGVKATKGIEVPVQKCDDVRFAKVASLDWKSLNLTDVPIAATVMACLLYTSPSPRDR